MVQTAVERRISQSMPLPKDVDRRKVRESRVVVPDRLQKGWLAFQSGRERRRLAPIPADWSEMTTRELVELLEQADRRTRRRRLVE